LVQLAALQTSLPDQASETVAKLAEALEQATGAAADLLSRLSQLAYTANQLMEETDFNFFLDPERKVFTVGYNVWPRLPITLTTICWLRKHGSQLCGDRERRRAAGAVVPFGSSTDSGRWRRALISWTGTMFEYLMPLLVMRNYPGTLLDETYRTSSSGKSNTARNAAFPGSLDLSVTNSSARTLIRMEFQFNVAV